MAAVVRAALRVLRSEPERRDKLHRLIAFAEKELAARTEFKPSGSQIQPLIIGGDAEVVALADRLKKRGYDISAIRPPTVPQGTARVRMTITLNVDEAKISGLIGDLEAARAERAA
jgi:8-amino-7-oxononanoate synthase